MPNQPTARTPGAKRAGPGEYVFDLGTVQKIMGGPAYSNLKPPGRQDRSKGLAYGSTILSRVNGA